MPDIFQDSSQYFHISAFYALSLPYYHMEHHTHSSYEIMYITSGSCRVFCLDGTQDTEFPLKSGQFIFCRTLNAASGWQIFSVFLWMTS